MGKQKQRGRVEKAVGKGEAEGKQKRRGRVKHSGRVKRWGRGSGGEG